MSLSYLIGLVKYMFGLMVNHANLLCCLLSSMQRFVVVTSHLSPRLNSQSIGQSHIVHKTFLEHLMLCIIGAVKVEPFTSTGLLSYCLFNKLFPIFNYYIITPEKPASFLPACSSIFCICSDGKIFSGLSVANTSVDPSQPVHGSNLSPPTVLQFGKSRKLSAERSDPRK